MGEGARQVGAFLGAIPLGFGLGYSMDYARTTKDPIPLVQAIGKHIAPNPLGVPYKHSTAVMAPVLLGVYYGIRNLRSD